MQLPAEQEAIASCLILAQKRLREQAQWQVRRITNEGRVGVTVRRCIPCARAKLLALVPLGFAILPIVLSSYHSGDGPKGQAQPFSTVPPPQVTLESPFTHEPPPVSDFGTIGGSQEASFSPGGRMNATVAALGAVGAVWAAGLGSFALWRRREAKLTTLEVSQAPPKPCDQARLAAGAGLIVVVDLFLGLPAAYVIIAGAGVTPPAIAAEIFETVVVLPLNLVGLYLMGESGCISMGQPGK